MKIEKLKKMSNGKYKIYLDNDAIINTYDDVILKNNLLYHKEIKEELIEELIKDNNYYDLYHKCISFISKRLRSEKEVREYLKKYTSNNKDIDKIINKLKEIGLIDDLLFMKAYIIDRITFSNVGPLKIIDELLEHDIDKALIDIEIENIDPLIIRQKLEKYINKKVANNTKYSSLMLKQKLENELLNYGYRKEDIMPLLDKCNIKNNIEVEFKKQYKKLTSKYSGNELVDKLKIKLYQKGYSKEEIEEIVKKMDF